MANAYRKEVERMIRILVSDHGCTARRTGHHHHRVTRPGFGAVTMAGTPSDPRALDNIRADIRRYLGIRI